MKLLKKFTLPIAIILFICILCSMVILLKNHFENPFVSQKPLGEASKIYEDLNGTKYVITQGNCTILVLKNGKFQYSVQGGVEERAFFYARDMVTDERGHLYVLDTVPGEDGKSVGKERIVEFDSKGRYQKILFERSHTLQEKERKLYGLNLLEHKICVASVKDAKTIETIYLDVNTGNCVTDSLNSKIRIGSIWDLLFLEKDVIIYSTKAGKIMKLSKDTGSSTLFEASKNAGKEYCSIPTEIEIGEDGNLYFSDIGRRGIYRLNLNNFSECTLVLDGMDAVVCSNLNYSEFADKPIFYSFYVDSTGKMNALLNRAPDINSTDKYAYVLYEKQKNGKLIELGKDFPKSNKLFLQSIILGIFILIEVFLLFIIVRALYKSKIKFELSYNAKFQIPIIMTAIMIAGVVSIICIRNSNERYYNTYMDKLEIVANLIGREITEKEMNQIKDASSFEGEDYQRINAVVTKILSGRQDSSSEMYCVLYKKVNDVCQIIYSDENLYGTAYPLVGNFRNFEENEIYTNKKAMRFFSIETQDGNNMFVLSPVLNSRNEVIALAEVGTDLYMQQQEDKQLFMKLMVLVFSAVILIILVISELSVNYNLNKTIRKKQFREKRYYASMIRPIMFLFCFVTNMPNAFLPVYGRKLWHAGMWITPDLAGALPISAEMGSVAVFTLLLGRAVEKIGSKKMCFSGAVIMILANILYGISSIWIVFTGAAVLNGLGAAMLLLSLNTYIMGFEEEECTNGFIHYNAAYLSGMNIGVIIGAYLAEQFGDRIPFYIGALLMMGVIPIIGCTMNETSRKVQKTVKEEHIVIKIWHFITSPNVWKFYLFMYIPYMCCQAFPQYYFPLFGQNNHLTTTQISIAFLIGGVISIYLGSTFTNIMSNYLGSKKAMIVAAGTIITGFTIFGLFPTVANAFLMIGLLAVTDCYVLTLMSVYYASLGEVRTVGEGVSMSIYGTLENVSMVIGPILFACLTETLKEKGMIAYGMGFLICIILFAVHAFHREKSLGE